MPPLDPEEIGESLPEPTPEEDPGQGIANCYRAIENEPEESLKTVEEAN